MRILHCYPHACFGGGASNDFRSLTISLLKYYSTIEVHVVFPTPPNVSITQRQHSWELPFQVTGASSTYWPEAKQYDQLSDHELEEYFNGAYRSLLKLVDMIKPDLIHGHLLLPGGWAAARIGEEYGIPTIITSHGADVKVTEADDRYLKRSIHYFRNVKYLIGYSPDHKEWIQSLLPKSFKNKVTYIPGGIDTDSFLSHVDSTSIEKKYGLPHKGFVLAVGRFQKRKGFHLLLEAAQKIHFPIVLIGGGWEAIALREQAVRQGLTNVRILDFLGPRQSAVLKKFYSAAGVVVIPSLTREETLCFVGLEAMASGTPVIASNVGGLKFILDEGRTGVLIQPGDVNILANTINEVMHDPDLRMNLVKAARLYVEKQFRWERVAQEYFNLYKKVLR
ncbi:MAG: glycosyltransferase family 4 protein [Candidatus Uhrbacteria bacterium]|nr:glycosyltransferase family 4 protein [Candidatus Uhrbacteria bacterium]